MIVKKSLVKTMNSMSKTFIILAALVAVGLMLLFQTKSPDQANNRINFPYYASCKEMLFEEVNQYNERYGSRQSLKANIHRFIEPVSYNEDLEGSVELLGFNTTYSDLQVIYNTLRSQCFPQKRSGTELKGIMSSDLSSRAAMVKLNGYGYGDGYAIATAKDGMLWIYRKEK